jgi:hypothetical protein
MTTTPQAVQAILDAFDDVWSVGPVSAYTFDGEQFDPPDNASWVRVSIRHTFAGQESLGVESNRRFRREGAVFVQCFSPANQGSKAAVDLAHTARAIFEGVTLAGTSVNFTDCSIRETGPDDKWYGVTLEALFAYDEIK